MKPIRWKLFMLVWLCVYPSILLLSALVRLALPTDSPAWLVMLCVSMVLVFLMIYFIIPTLTKVFAFWLFPKK